MDILKVLKDENQRKLKHYNSLLRYKSMLKERLKKEKENYKKNKEILRSNTFDKIKLRSILKNAIKNKNI